ncbi:exodeoxyribonuclease V subunit gamma [Alteromonas sp. KUL49]|uniref:exodeoxyribonuclease V subunit gamma n=1 Tax=Alteromonas sp. KUL49 TaxID=2480798 RepID=UPI0010FFC3D0|nr:exodeoxyribonuclease V subunit gamma [Alteromonas sp. KUL49]GEA13004.1 RecBCD enzyme subunit RecC [Alteromonas sp. KUL49]
MLALYPSNKIEHLSFLLATLLEQQQSSIFESQTILVESPGMQHWVNMELAKHHGVAMNLDFPLPVRFMWNAARAILGEDTIPRQSPYRREILTWRIDELIQRSDIQNKPEFSEVNAYWQTIENSQERGVQRLQFSTAMADVYEQYLMYRPEWLLAWEAGESLSVQNSMEPWQGELWRELVSQNPLHPAGLLKSALSSLQQGTVPEGLPSSVIVFAINTMAPQFVQLLDALSTHIDIHIFHLNPSVNYWGDAKSRGEQARVLREQGIEKWMSEAQSHPLLGNLGKQGRELFNLLTELNTFEVSAFDIPPLDEEHTSNTLLQRIQIDILHGELSDAPVNADDSLTIVSAHSALREVQLLHDHLLHWLSQDPDRSPSDILVMCPAIENYAPFVDSIFQRVGTFAPTREVPRLPCSIADRSPLDANPIVSAFISLLSLPDSRFGVVDIVDYLQLPAVQRKFEFTQDDVAQMTVWLHKAHVHWGLDAHHKALMSETEDTSIQDTYTWWWGLKRLLLGMAATDSETLVNGLLTVPDVEGQNTLVLGKLIDLVSALQQQARLLNQNRTASEWHRCLVDLLNTCFDADVKEQSTWDMLTNVCADLELRCEEAGYTSELQLSQVRMLLLNRFSSPDAGNHFMTGQVTVCSMLPMRSIPFKKVCILGLNDGEFPRQSTPMGLDLMAQSSRKIGDRSRRLEDRYLFLEALISARDSIYLSYQGNDVRNNNERQTSLVLGELLDVLINGYGLLKSTLVTQAPLHPFSEGNFTRPIPSYEAGWLRLTESMRHQMGTSESLDEIETVVLNDVYQVSDIANAFNDPLSYFGRNVLGVYLTQPHIELDSSEPFDVNSLVRYQVVDALIDDVVGPVQHNASFDAIELATMRGDIPQTPATEVTTGVWKEATTALHEAIGDLPQELTQVSWQGEQFQIQGVGWLADDSTINLCPTAISDKRGFAFYLSQLCFCASGIQQPLDVFFPVWEKGEYNIKVARYAPVEPQIAKDMLSIVEELFSQLHRCPTPIYLSLITELVKKAGKNDVFEYLDTAQAYADLANWQTQSNQSANIANDNPYLSWLLPSGISMEHINHAPIFTLLSHVASIKKVVKL